MQENLKQKAISGAIWSSVQKFGLSGISFLSNIVLARILSPSDYGCIGMLSIFIVVSTALVYGGFVSALIQKKDTSAEDYSTVFIWNLVVACILYCILFICAPGISDFYGIEKLSSILRVQGIILIINGFCAIQTTLLRKQLEFGKLAKVNITSALISVIVAIVLAYNGLGVWSLVFQQITVSALNCLILWSISVWKPSLKFSIKSFYALFSYGSFLLLNDLFNSLCDNMQGLLIGKKFSASTLGLYTQARRLEEVPTQSISQMVAQVTFPIYSKIQDDDERLKRAVKSSLSLMNFINFPLMILLIIVAKPLIVLLFTEKWVDSVPLFQILCLAGVVNCLQSVNYQVVSACGRSKELFYWNFIKRGVGIALMLLGLNFGVQGVMWGMAISFYFVYIVNAKLAYKSTRYSIYAQIKDSIPLLLISIFAGLFTHLLTYMDLCSISLLIFQIAVYLLSYYFLAIIFKRTELDDIQNIILRRNL